jgi:hypothetical protein
MRVPAIPTLRPTSGLLVRVRRESGLPRPYNPEMWFQVRDVWVSARMATCLWYCTEHFSGVQACYGQYFFSSLVNKIRSNTNDYSDACQTFKKETCRLMRMHVYSGGHASVSARDQSATLSGCRRRSCTICYYCIHAAPAIVFRSYSRSPRGREHVVEDDARHL